MIILEFDSQLECDNTGHGSLSSSELNARHSEINFDCELLVITVLFRDHWVSLLEKSGIDRNQMGSKVLNHELGIDFVLEPVLALHCFHQAVGHAVGHNELDVFTLVVVLEVVVMLVVGNQAVAGLGTNIKEERKI